MKLRNRLSELAKFFEIQGTTGTDLERGDGLSESAVECRISDLRISDDIECF